MTDLKYQQLKQYLLQNCVGLRNAKLSSDICRGLGISSRELRDPIPTELLRDGVLLCSDSSGQRGYFIPVNRKEFEIGTRHLRSRAMIMLHRLKLADKLAEESFGIEQTQLFEVG